MIKDMKTIQVQPGVKVKCKLSFPFARPSGSPKGEDSARIIIKVYDFLFLT